MKKICTKCGVGKSLDVFCSEKRNKNGKAAECKDCRRAWAAARYKENPEIVKAKVKKWTENNPEKVRARAAEWQRKNPEKVKARNAKWKAANKDTANAGTRKRRALLRGVEGLHHTAIDVKTLVKLQDGLCCYCWNRLESYHVDHIVPLSRGGGNGPDNICLACPTCNTSKGNKLLGLEWVPPYRADAPKISLAFL